MGQQENALMGGRVHAPELLYIWLLSFNDLRLAMNACVPLVRLLLCYAPPGDPPHE